jgi:vacuolar-type H+-ATPase subunit F/Vma7
MSGKHRFKTLEEGHLIAVIGDEDTITGFLLAGTGHVEGVKRSANFLVVTSSMFFLNRMRTEMTNPLFLRN